MIDDISIIGAGPAGSYLAYLLARSGIYATVFDHSHPREKPCGGAISPLALRKFPILQNVPGSRVIDKIMLVSPKGREVMLHVPKNSGLVVSREHADMYLLQQAIDSGAKLVRERVIDIEAYVNGWTIRTGKGDFRSKVIVGADGVNSVVRKAIVGRIPKKNLGACIGHFAGGFDKDYGIIRFLEGLTGYAWIFPRDTYSSIGVGVDAHEASGLKDHLAKFVNQYVPNMERLSSFGATIPAIRDPRFFDIPCSGHNWVVIGDAAGHVNPLTGEGIFYALWAAELAAEAITKGNPKKFDVLWRTEYHAELVEACKLVKLVYNRRLLEFAIMVASRSKGYADILAELLTNEQSYRGLFKRIIARLPSALVAR